jgi:hypothetical protein
MPKKTASARGGASRNKPKSQKSIKLVRPTPAETDMQDDSGVEETTLAAPSPTPKATSTATASRPEVTTTTKKSGVENVPSQKEKDVTEMPAANMGSAAARLAARRQATLKQQVQRNVNLVTAEHYAYVRRDLIYILILAVIMFSAIIVLHFVPAIGG